MTYQALLKHPHKTPPAKPMDAMQKVFERSNPFSKIYQHTTRFENAANLLSKLLDAHKQTCISLS